MKHLETMRLTELKEILLEKTNLDFEIAPTKWNNSEVIIVKGLKGKDELRIGFSKYTTNDERDNKRFISFGGAREEGQSGFGIPCDNISELLEWLYKKRDWFKYPIPTRQKEILEQMRLDI